MFALEVNEILQTTPPKLRREMGMCGNAAIMIYVGQQYYTSSTRCTYSSLEPLVAGAAAYTPETWYTVHASTQQTTESEVRGSASRVKTPREQGQPHHVLQARRRLPHARRRRSEVCPWNVRPLRNTTLRGIRSARRSLYGNL